MECAGRFTAGTEPRLPLKRETYGPHSWSGRFGWRRNLLPKAAIEPRTVLPVAQPLHTLCYKKYKRSVIIKSFNPSASNDVYVCRTAQLTSRRCILKIYSTNIVTEYFKHAAHSPVFSLQDAVYFIMLSFLVPVIFTF